MSTIFSFIKHFGIVNFMFIMLTLVNPLELGYLFGYISIGLLVLQKGIIQNKLDSFFLVMLVFSLTYALFYFLNPWKGMQYFLIYLLTPPVFYLWGKQFSASSNDNVQKFILLIIVGVLFSLPALISVTLNIAQGGFAQPERNIPMFWGGAAINATGMGTLFMFNMCIPGMLIAGFKDLQKKLVLLLVVVFVLSLACVLRLGSRTQLGIMLISLVVAFVYITPKLSLKQNIMIYTLFAGVIFLVVQNISFDLDSDLFTSFAGRMKDNGAKDLAGGGGRVELWELSMEYMLKYPLGWDLDAFGYSHNLWLDAFRVGGFIAATLLILFFVKIVLLVYKVIRSKLLEVPVRIILLVYMVSFLSVFMVEPGIDGALPMFLFFCFFSGITFETYWASSKKHLR